MADLTGILPPSWQEKHNRDVAPRPVEEQITVAMADAGIQAPSYFDIDGEIHRFKTDGKDKSGWYIFYPDNIVAGSFGDWRTGVELNFCANVGREITATELQEQKRRISLAREAREIERQKQYKQVSDSVQEIWDKAQPASAQHLYLAKKGIQPHGARIGGDGRLILPLLDDSGQISSIQYISHDSSKLYHKGGKTSGCFYVLGSPVDTVFIAEGFATAASIYEATGTPTIAAYSASNIVKVAEIVSKHIKNITVVADNDESGVGQKYADQASAKYGCSVIVPPELGDANDFLQKGGDLKALLEPEPKTDWLEWVDDFCSQPAPIKWHIKGWWQKNSLMMVHGPSGGGKTFYVLDSALRMASGIENWCGKKVRPGSVVYLAGEGHHGLRGRIACWRQANGIRSSKMLVSKSGCDLNTTAGYQKVVDSINPLPESPDVIIVDTLHRFLEGDENSAQDAKTMLDACSRLMDQYDCSVILVHHTGVSMEAQGRARGSSAWKGALDIEISVTPTGKGYLQVSQKKNKDSEESEPLHFELKSVAIDGWFDEDGEQVTSAILSPVAAPEKVAKPTKNDKYLQLLKGAWQFGNCEVLEDKPYISRAAFINYCESLGDSPASAKQKSKPSDEKRPIGSLMLSGVIDQILHGYTLLDAVQGSAWMMSNECKNV